MDIEIQPGAAAAAHALHHLRQADLFQIGAGAQRMQPHAVADLSGNAQHRLADRGDGDRDHRQAGGFGGEVRGHQRQLVVRAVEVQPPAGFPGLPHRAQRLARSRACAAPGRSTAMPKRRSLWPFTWLPRPRTKRPPELAWMSQACCASVVGLRGKATTTDGVSSTLLGRQRGEGQRRQRIVAQFDRHQRVETGGLGGCGGGCDVAPVRAAAGWCRRACSRGPGGVRRIPAGPGPRRCRRR